MIFMWFSWFKDIHGLLLEIFYLSLYIYLYSILNYGIIDGEKMEKF